MKVINKVPGLKFEVQQMRMDLLYASKFDDKAQPMPEAYERLMLEVSHLPASVICGAGASAPPYTAAVHVF